MFGRGFRSGILLCFVAGSPAWSQIMIPLPSRARIQRNDSVTLSNIEPLLRLHSITAPRALHFPDWLFPVKLSQTAAQAFWDQDRIKPLTAGVITAQSQVLGANMELVSNVVGPFRLGFGGNVTAENPDPKGGAAAAGQAQEQATLNRLLQNGGLVHLTAAYPVMYKGNSTGENAVALMLRSAVAADAPRINSISDLQGVAGMLSADLFGQTLGANGNLGVEGGLNAQWFALNTHYQSTLGVSSGSVGVVGLRLGGILLRRTHIGAFIPFAKSSNLDGKIKSVFYVQQTGI